MINLVNKKQRFITVYHLFIYQIYIATFCTIISFTVPIFKLQEWLALPMQFMYIFSPILLFVMLYENVKFYKRLKFTGIQVINILVVIFLYAYIFFIY